MAKLSKRLIDSITSPEKDVMVWDDSLSGFGIRAKPSGVKSFPHPVSQSQWPKPTAVDRAGWQNDVGSGA